MNVEMQRMARDQDPAQRERAAEPTGCRLGVVKERSSEHRPVTESELQPQPSGRGR